MDTKTFRCSGRDWHFVTVSHYDEGIGYLEVEDFLRTDGIWNRIKCALEILVHGYSFWTEVLLNEKDAKELSEWLANVKTPV